MTKTKSVYEDNISKVIDKEELEGWQFVSMTQSSPGSFYAEPYPRSFPATYLLIFRKQDQTHNDFP